MNYTDRKKESQRCHGIVDVCLEIVYICKFWMFSSFNIWSVFAVFRGMKI